MGNGSWFVSHYSMLVGAVSADECQNKRLSDDLEPALALQNVSWVARQAVGLVSVALHLQQSQGLPLPPSASSELTTIIEVRESVVGLFGMDRMVHKTTMKFCLDSVWREKHDPVFGSVRSHCSWVSPGNIEETFLLRNWLEGEAEATGPSGESHIMFHVESLSSGWTATQIWGFQVIQGQRRHVRNIVVRRYRKTVCARVVYDYTH